MHLLVGLKHGCILNLVQFGCAGAEKRWGSVLVCGGFGLWFNRKIRPTQRWVELSWVVAIRSPHCATVGKGVLFIVIESR